MNSQLKRGGMASDEALKALERELLRLRKHAGGRANEVNLSPVNRRNLASYWEAAYAHRDLIDPKASKYRLQRAVEALGETPLTASREEIQKALNEAFKGRPNRQRDAVSAITQILVYLGRTDIKLMRAKKERRRILFVTLAEWQRIVGYLEPIYKTLGWVAITTGCRTGEIFSLSPAVYRKPDRTVFVHEQKDRELTLRQTKNRRDRDVPILAEGVPHLEAWLQLDTAAKDEIRNVRLADIIRKACRQAFPEDKSKWLKFHDLRHSYAIHLLNKGVSVGLVAQCLGDSEAVVAEAYVGFVLTKPGMDAVKALIG